MFLLRRPTSDRLRAFLSAQARASFSYPEVGRSRGAAPAGYTVDDDRVLLGSGMETYHRAVAGLQSWRHFDLAWCRLEPSRPALEVGSNVAVLFRHFGFWSLNACRIVYVVDEARESRRRYGYAYGTLADHAETGEERFLIEWDAASGEVFYEIHAFSRPRHLLARLGYPLSRWLQRRFVRESKQAMARAVQPRD